MTPDATRPSPWPAHVREAAAQALANLSATKGRPDAVDYDVTDVVLAAIAPHVVSRAIVLDLAAEIDGGAVGHIDEYVSGERAIAERLRALAGRRA